MCIIGSMPENWCGSNFKHERLNYKIVLMDKKLFVTDFVNQLPNIIVSSEMAAKLLDLENRKFSPI
jgi:hypothetical protein